MKKTLLALMVSALPLLGQFTFTDLPFMAQSMAVTGGEGPPPLTPVLQGLALWYDANASNTMANGTTFPLVFDLTGNGNHSTNYTVATPPFLTNNVINGKSAWHLASAANYGWQSIPSAFPLSNASAAEIFYVLRNTVTNPATGEGSLLTMFGPGSQASVTLNPYHGSAQSFGDGFAQTNTQAYTNWPRYANNFDAWRVYNVRITNGEQQVYNNGDLVGGQDRAIFRTGITNFTFGVDVNANRYFKGWIAEVLLYTNYVTEAYRTNLYRYMSNKYALVVTNWHQPEETFCPTNIGNLWAWYSGTSLDGNFADGAAVTNWADLSGNGRHLTNRLTYLCPTMKSNAYNGKSCLSFDSSKTNKLMFTSTNYTSGLNEEMWAVFVVRYTNSDAVLLSSKVNNYRWSANNAGTAAQWLFNNNVSENSHVPSNVLQVISYHQQTNGPIGGTWAVRAWFNTKMVTDWSGNGYGATFDQIGCKFDNTLRAGGELCEVVLFKGHISYADYCKLYFWYLKPKWGIP